MSKICVSFAEQSLASLLEKFPQAEAEGAEAIEVWLGELDQPDVERIRSHTSLPLIGNCKGPTEQGGFTGSEDEKMALLLRAAKAGFEYVDFDHHTSSQNAAAFIREKPSGCRVILSAHYFEGTPGLPALTRHYPKMIANGADIVKFAAMPKSFKDVVTMIRLAEKLQSKGIPHVVISMSELGKGTRILGKQLGNEFVFAALDKKNATAPGQISAKDLYNIFKIL